MFEGTGAERARTADLLVANQTLSQLSYGPESLLSYRTPGLGGRATQVMIHDCRQPGQLRTVLPCYSRLPVRYGLLEVMYQCFVSETRASLTASIYLRLYVPFISMALKSLSRSHRGHSSQDHSMVLSSTILTHPRPTVEPVGPLPLIFKVQVLVGSSYVVVALTLAPPSPNPTLRSASTSTAAFAWLLTSA